MEEVVENMRADIRSPQKGDSFKVTTSGAALTS
jgi:hypothetical protein